MMATSLVSWLVMGLFKSRISEYRTFYIEFNECNIDRLNINKMNCSVWSVSSMFTVAKAVFTR